MAREKRTVRRPSTLALEYSPGRPIPADELARNAYIMGFEHGALDWAQSWPFVREKREWPDDAFRAYQNGRAAGKRARSRALGSAFSLLTTTTNPNARLRSHDAGE